MIKELQIQLKDGKIHKLAVEYKSLRNQYLNFNELVSKSNGQLNHFFIENCSQSLQVQLDLSNAPKAFIVGFDRELKKVGVSVNFHTSAAPFSMLLPEKYYLVVPIEDGLKPQEFFRLIWNN